MLLVAKAASWRLVTRQFGRSVLVASGSAQTHSTCRTAFDIVGRSLAVLARNPDCIARPCVAVFWHNRRWPSGKIHATNSRN
jgi:hypothetical protein